MSPFKGRGNKTMNYRSLGARAAAGVLAFFCVPTMAQQHFDIEVRLGAAVPSERYGCSAVRIQHRLAV